MACSPGTLKSGPLYLHRNATEKEQRPIEPCTDFWMCPDIKIVGGIDDGTVKGPDQPGKTRTNSVSVTVWNARKEPISNVRGQVWVCDFGVGIGPKGAAASAGGPDGVGGVEWLFDTVPGTDANKNGQILNWSTVLADWDVTWDDVQRNNGHHCIIANVYGDDVGAKIPIKPLPQQDVIFICCDSHHGWRNINVFATSGLRIEEEEVRFEFPFMVGNPTWDELEGTLTVTQIGREGFGPTERDHLLSGGLAEWTDPRQDPECTRLVLPGDAQLPREEQVLVGASPHGMLDLGLGGDLGSGAEVPFRIGPDDQVPMRIEGVFDRATRPGEVLTFDVVQRDRNGDVLSGARMLAAVGH